MADAIDSVEADTKDRRVDPSRPQSSSHRRPKSGNSRRSAASPDSQSGAPPQQEDALAAPKAALGGRPQSSSRRRPKSGNTQPGARQPGQVSSALVEAPLPQSRPQSRLSSMAAVQKHPSSMKRQAGEEFVVELRPLTPEKLEELHKAVLSDDVSSLHELEQASVWHNSDIIGTRCCDKYGNSLLDMAISAGAHDVVKFFYSRIAKMAVNEDRSSARVPERDQPKEALYPSLPRAVVVGQDCKFEPRANRRASKGIFAVNPALPRGLQLDQDTGDIHGTPTEEIESTEYVVAISQEADQMPYERHFFMLAVQAPLIGLHYKSVEQVVHSHTPERPKSQRQKALPPLHAAVEPRAKSSQGSRPQRRKSVLAEAASAPAAFSVVPQLQQGRADRWQANPPLPPGMVIDEATGVISGTPRVPSHPACSYHEWHAVVATNLAGSATCHIEVELRWGSWGLLVVSIVNHSAPAAQPSEGSMMKPTLSGASDTPFPRKIAPLGPPPSVRDTILNLPRVVAGSDSSVLGSRPLSGRKVTATLSNSSRAWGASPCSSRAPSARG